MAFTAEQMDQFVNKIRDSILPEVEGLIEEKMGASVSSKGPNTQIPENIERSSTRPAGQPAEDVIFDEEAQEDTDLDPLAHLEDSSWKPPEMTEKCLDKYLRRNLSKDERSKLLDRFPVPTTVSARPPKLDKPIQQLLAQKKINLNQIPSLLAVEAIQTRMLDAIGPLSSIHAAAVTAKSKNELLHPDAVLEALNHSLILIGNANAQASFQRQRSVMSKINPSLIGIIPKEAPTEITGELFGSQIRKAMKDASDTRKEFCSVERPTSRPYRSFRNTYRQQAPGGWRQDARSRPYDRNFRRPFQRPKFTPSYSKQETGTSHAEGAGKVYWIDNCSKTGNAVIDTQNSISTVKSYSYAQKGFFVGHKAYSKQGLRKGPDLVEQATVIPTFTDKNGASVFGDRIRFKYGRMGLDMQRNKDRWAVDIRRLESKSPHQSTGTTCSVPRTSMFLVPQCPYSASKDGQQDCSGLCKSFGGHTITTTKLLSIGNVGVVPETEHMDEGRVPSGFTEPNCRLGVQTFPRLLQLETISEDFSDVKQEVSVQSGPICGQVEQPNAEIRQLETGSNGMESGCVLNTLDGVRVCIPSLLLDREMHSEMHQRESNDSPHCPSLAQPAVVPLPPSPTYELPSDPPRRQQLASGSSGGTSSVNSEKEDDIGSMANIRQPVYSNVLSRRANEVIASSIRPKSKKAYASAWKRFCRWCDSRQRNPLQASINEVINFLTELHEEKLTYNTICLYRSALSYHLPHFNNSPIGQDPTIVRFVRGVFNINPPVPRYCTTWNPEILITYIESLPDNRDMTFSELSKKLVCLLALTKACRASDIGALDLSSMMTVREGVVFKHLHLRKTSRPGFLPDSFFPRFSVKKLCVVDTLSDYISKSAAFRNDNRLILSTRKPHKPASSSTISHWILDMMKAAGIDTTVFKSHSIRSSAVSKAFSRNISIGDIQKCADWSSPHTFVRFYHRYCDKDQFANAVLGIK